MPTDTPDEIELDLPDEFDVAVVVLARAAGVDRQDAADRVTQALNRLTRDGLPLPHRGGDVKDKIIRVADVMEAGMAAGNGYLWLQPTKKAFLERPGFYAQPDE